jgi:hypothetical protein
MLGSRTLRVPSDSDVVVIRNGYTWTVPGAVGAVAVLVLLGAVRGGGSSHTAPPNREAVVAEAAGVALRAEPRSDAAKVADLPYNRQVTIVCHTDGPAAGGWGGTSTVWDRITVDGATGYAPDVAINTHVTVARIAPRC